jgi:hypothetical protein
MFGRHIRQDNTRRVVNGRGIVPPPVPPYKPLKSPQVYHIAHVELRSDLMLSRCGQFVWSIDTVGPNNISDSFTICERCLCEMAGVQ